MPQGFPDSDRRRRLPPDWAAIRHDILNRDEGRCRAVDNDQRCGAPATEVDHIQRSGPDSPDNLASLCAHHHRRKTAAEGNQARQRNRREPESHPGMNNPRMP